MRRTLLRVFTIVLVIVFSMMILSSCAENEEICDVTINRGNFEKCIDSDDLSFTVTEIDKSRIDDEDVIATILYLMEVADANYVAADYLAKISIGEGSATAGPLVGKMAVRSFSIREPERSYYQTAGRVYEGSDQALLKAAQILLDQGKRTLTLNRNTDDEITYKQEPKNKGNPTMIEEFPYASCDYSKGKLTSLRKGEKDPKEPDTTLKYPGELTNFDIAQPGAIVLDTASVVYNASKKFYTVSFELDLSTQELRDAITEKPRDGLRYSASSTDLEYVKYKVVMEIFDNGLIKTYSTEESWQATLKLGISISGASESNNTDYYSWDEDDCDIDEYVQEGIIAINWIS